MGVPWLTAAERGAGSPEKPVGGCGDRGALACRGGGFTKGREGSVIPETCVMTLK